jgi:putative spermidine/putrescine transport system substrate-binding protein
VPASLGDREGNVRLVAYVGYADQGWVAPFEAATGCRVEVTRAGSSDEIAAAAAQPGVDVVSASGLLAPQLIADGRVAPLNTTLIPNYEGLFDGLRGQRATTVGDTVYGVPHGRGANLLMWRTDVVNPAPESWSIVFDPDSPYAGRITGYDAPIAIADAAVYLAAARPQLGITDPYALDETQFDAVVAMLKLQHANVGRYWSLYSDVQSSFTSGESVVGTGWQVIRELLVAGGVPVEIALPSEGATGWSDSWLIASDAPHPSCAYAWLDHIISPAANAAAAVHLGEAPVSAAACVEAERISPGHCAIYHAADEDYFSRVRLWRLPQRDCGDDREEACVDYAAWEAAWVEIEAGGP